MDESHVTVPQIGGMYRGDRSRKETLVEFGFRLPSALDNRPLNFEEFEETLHQTVYVSATPADYEIMKSGHVRVEQLIRPTGLTDPEIVVRPAATQVDDLLEEIRKRTAVNARVLVTTLTKRMAEDLTDYYQDLNVKVRYLHSDIDAIERVEIIRDLRKGVFDVLVGINLLREGLDLPEVSLGCHPRRGQGGVPALGTVVDPDHRTRRAQRGRHRDPVRRRHDRFHEAGHRRDRAQAWGPEGLQRGTRHRAPKRGQADRRAADPGLRRDYVDVPLVADDGPAPSEIPRTVAKLKKEMKQASDRLEFEKAAEIRDRIRALQEKELSGPYVARGVAAGRG